MNDKTEPTETAEISDIETPQSLVPLAPQSSGAIGVFSSLENFELAQRMARALSTSPLVPDTFRGDDNIGSTMIALDMAQRLGANPLMVMQNLDVIHGRPSWRATFIAAAINASGRFAALRFEMTGDEGADDRGCQVWTYDKSNNERVEGPKVTVTMAKAENWYGKKGSKWQTMPELMLRYRAAAFFGRLHASDILMGMQTREEIEDVKGMIDITPTIEDPPKAPPRKRKTAAKKTPPKDAEKPAEKAEPATDRPNLAEPRDEVIESEATGEPEVIDADPETGEILDDVTGDPAGNDEEPLFGDD